MKLIIFTFLLCLVFSCRPKNEISIEQFPNYDQQLFLSLEHPDGQSLLRQKLLNLQLRKYLNDTSRLEKKEEIEVGDELVIGGVSKKLSPEQLSQYNRLQSHCTKIVVSYKNRVEIYFAAAGIDIKTMIKNLNLIHENNHPITVFSHGEKTEVGEVVYVLNAGAFEMKLNDRNFHKSEFEIYEKIDGQKIKIDSNQKLSLLISAKHFIDQFVSADMITPKSKCTPQKMEADACEPCRYKMEILASNKVEVPLKTLTESHLEFFLNGKLVPEKDLTVIKTLSGEWKIELDPQKIEGSGDELVLEIKHQNELIHRRHVQGFDYTPNCLEARTEKDIEFKEIFPVKMKAIFEGRELLIDSIEE